MASTSRSPFVARFDRIWSQARRVQLMQSLCWGVLTVLAGVALLSAADYWLELSWELRIAALVAVAVGAVAVAIMLAVQSVRRWRRQATAAAIEQVFPQLGQRIRTTVQFGPLSSGEIEEEGVATTLVCALEDDTVERAQPLPLDAVVPWKSLAFASLLAAVVGLSLAGASAVDWEWRTAASRAFLGDEPYTKITVEPGDVTVKEGESAMLQVVVEGRTGEEVAFWSRRGDKQAGEWEEAVLTADDAIEASELKQQFEIPLERIRHPVEYRIRAGSAQSEVYRVKVLYPLKIAKIESAVQPPEYTGLKAAVSESGNITALVGSDVKLTIELDRASENAWLEMAPMDRREREAATAEKLPLTVDGAKLAASFMLTTDQTYSIFAKAADGMELVENKFRIRVRQDQPPQVWFESPAEALEVHSLAEIVMRARVNDDFGLTRAGIVFEINNEEEYPLALEEFAAAAEELESTGTLSPQTRATLEKVLPLEHFALSQQDSVMYYAFAEDNLPDSPQRTESDLRFIDIRPFRRLYRVFDAPDGTPMGQGAQLKSLEELIARQRYALNRTIQLMRRFERSGQADLAGVDSLIKFEGELAKSTRELAEGLEARGIDETELLYQAETAMLAATDSLAAGKYDTATLQQRDALKDLIEGRNRLEIFIRKNPNRQLLAQLRAFDRMQRQKLRKPKTDEEEAREVAERLKELADQEDFIYKTLAGIDMPGKGQNGQSGRGKPEDMLPKKENPENEGGESTTSSDAADPSEEAKPKADTLAGENQDGENQAEQSGSPGPVSREELEDRQLDIALEAREIEKTLNRLNGVTDLAKERIAAAAQTAEEAAAALSTGDTPEAQTDAEAAGKQFRELADQVKALLAEEQAQRIAAAQQMASQLARRQQDFADRLAQTNQQGGAGGKPQEDEEDRPGAGEKKKQPPEDQPPGIGGMAEEIAEKAETLNDVLGAVGDASEPQDQESAQKVQAIARAMKLDELIERLQNLPSQVGQGEMQEAAAAAGDGAERLESLAEQLAALHRSIVTPKVDELAKMEEKITALDEELDQLESPAEITAWHLDANELLDELEEAEFSDELRREFLEEMKKGGWGPDMRNGGWRWGRLEGGYYAAPAPYRVVISRILARVRGQMQELLLGELAYSRDEPIPPQYQELVDRYYQVLSAEGKTKD